MGIYLIGCLVAYVYVNIALCKSLEKDLGYSWAFLFLCMPVALLSWVLVIFLMLFYNKTEEKWNNIRLR